MKWPGPLSSLSFRLGAGVTVIVLAINVFAFHHLGQRTHALLEEGLRDVSRHLYQEMVTVRGWVAFHGGVYVPKRPGVEDNPFLTNDLAVTASGDSLVLRNPAMITREIAGFGPEGGLDVRFRVTSLDPINPANAPDAFEREALEEAREAHGRGEPLREIFRVDATEAGRRFRYLAPLYTESSCLDCHGAQGYRVGDVRGALSVSIPMAKVDRARSDFFWLSVLVCLLASAAIAALVYLFIERTVVRRVKNLERAAERIGQGDFDSPVGTGGNDEIGELARALERMQKEIRASTERQIETEKMVSLGEIAAGVAHDVRNPLFAVRSNLDYLRRNGSSDPDELEVMAEMEEGLGRIGRLVNEVSDFAKPKPPEFGRTNLSTLFERVLLLVGKQMERRQVQIEVELSDGDIEVVLDAHRMEQALLNLLTNAVRAVEEVAEPRIELHGRLEPKAIHIEVRDNGQGIDEEILPRIFDPFFTRSRNGTGLGLSIVRRVVVQHHGRVQVNSRPGQGSTFVLRVPRDLETTASEVSDGLPAARRR